jgi:hypothetical protein
VTFANKSSNQFCSQMLTFGRASTVTHPANLSPPIETCGKLYGNDFDFMQTSHYQGNCVEMFLNGLRNTVRQ